MGSSVITSVQTTASLLGCGSFVITSTQTAWWLLATTCPRRRPTSGGLPECMCIQLLAAAVGLRHAVHVGDHLRAH